MPKLLTLYDTSFIMNVDTPETFDLPPTFSEEHVIPLEVKKELKKHLDSPDKNLAARKGRTLSAKIMGRSDYREVSLAEVPIPELVEVLLGPDSDVDKRLLGFALQFLEADPSNAVFLTTHDGGIQAEVSVLQSQRAKHLFSPATKEKLIQYLYEHAVEHEEQIYKTAKKWSDERQSFVGRMILVAAVITAAIAYSLVPSGIAAALFLFSILLGIWGVAEWRLSRST